MLSNRLLLFVCLFCLENARAQVAPPCQTNGELAADFCEDACVLCNFNGYFGSTNGYLGGDVIPGFCGTIELGLWLGLIAASPAMDITLQPYNCVTGNGLQMALLKGDCANKEIIACDGGMQGGGYIPTTLSLNNLTPGNTYYLMIDGYAGDQCDFQVTVSPPSAVQAPALGSIGKILGPDVVCAGGFAQYSVPGVTGASYYEWNAPPGSLVNGEPSPLVVPAPEGKNVGITFGTTGGFVTVKPGNSCYTGPIKSLGMNIGPASVHTLPPLTLTEDQIPYQWLDGSAILTSGTYLLTLTSYTGCDSIIVQQIIVAKPFAAEGFAFNDINSDGQFNAGETPQSGFLVKTSSGLLANTDNAGRFYFTQISAGDTIFHLSNTPGVTVTPAFWIYQTNKKSGYDFALYSPAGQPDLQIDVTNSTLFRPGFLTTLRLTVRNNTALVANNAQIVLELPALLTYLSATPVTGVPNGKTLTFNLGTLSPNQTRVVDVVVQTALGTPLNTPVIMVARVLPLNDANPDNNSKWLYSEVRGSYDPNDKQVYPTHITPGMLDGAQAFEYTVRFQNTGNYPAEFVRVIDTLDSTVDPATFQFLSSSHPCTWRMRGAGIVEFLFENIQLPDSISNEPGSHGFVKFAVKPRPGLMLGTVVKNFCDIYFDFNTPIRTNTAGTQVVYFLPGEPPPAAGKLSAKPNPAAYQMYFSWKTPVMEHARLRFFDLNGVQRLESTIDPGSNSAVVDVSALSEGPYIAVLETETGRYVKLVAVLRGGPVK